MDNFRDSAVGDTVYVQRQGSYTKHTVDSVFKKYLEIDNGQKFSFDGLERPYNPRGNFLFKPSPVVETRYQEGLTRRYRRHIANVVLDEDLLSPASIALIIQLVVELTPEHN
jgi:hypothetical protein